MADLRETVHIDAPADLVYDLIADLPRMGEWSPECERVSWRGDVTAPAPRARFVGVNRAGILRWVTFGVVETAVPGRHLVFRIYIGPTNISRWEYSIAPDDDGCGCTVTEQWTDLRAAPARFLSNRMVSDRVGRNRRGIQQTLAALKRAAEHH